MKSFILLFLNCLELKLKTFNEAAELLCSFGEPTIAQLSTLSAIFPLLISEALRVGKIDFALYTHAKQLITKLLENRTWTSSLKQTLAVLRFMQVFILATSVHEDENDPDFSEDLLEEQQLKLGVSSAQQNTAAAAILQDGIALFREFVRLPRDLSSAALTAWLNLLQPIAQFRPVVLPTLIPSLLNFLEASSPLLNQQSQLSAPQRRNVLHCLKASLTVLTTVPKAEKFASLIADAVDKCADAEVTFTTGQPVVKGRKKTTSSVSVDQIDEEEEKELAASLGGIGERQSAAFASQKEAEKSGQAASPYESLASDVLLRELIKIPVPLCIEMVVRMLGTWTEEQIRATVTSRWPRRLEDSSSNAPSTSARPLEEAFKLQAEPLNPELPGEIIHFSMSRILQTLSDLTEFHLSGKREDLIAPLGSENVFAENGATVSAGKGIPFPLIKTCRMVALIAAHVGSVKSAALMDPEKRKKKRPEFVDPRARAQAAAAEDDDDEEDEKTVNQIVLSWINENLPMRFDFVWWWLEAVWIREGKDGLLEDDESSDYGKLFDDVVGLAGQFFTSGNTGADSETLSRVLQVFLRLPRLNPSFIRNLLFPLLEETERFRPEVLEVLAGLFLNRPAMCPMLADLLMTLAQSEDSGLRHAAIEKLLLRGQLYPHLKSLAAQLETFSLELFDSCLNSASKSLQPGLKRLKLDSQEALNTAEDEDSVFNESEESLEDANEEFVEIELFLGLLKKCPERLFTPLLVRFDRCRPALQNFLLDKAVPEVVSAWSVKELQSIATVLNTHADAQNPIVARTVQLILDFGAKAIKTAETPDATLVDFYEDFALLVAAKITSNSWNGSFVLALLPWLLRDQSDLPAFWSDFLPKLVAQGAVEFEAAAEKICARGGELIAPAQLFVQLHLISGVPLKTQIEVIQVCFTQAQAAAPALFTAAVLASGLSQLTELSAPLPALLGRSLLQSVALASPSTPLNPQLLVSLLAKLIARRAWTQQSLWEGWIRCVRALAPGSLSVLLQLPAEELAKVMQGGGADLKGPLKEYLYNQPPSVRNRYLSVLKTLEQ